ncbi:hypothetical protein J6Q66_06060 [bacterium]|nr:hypothetical protein [bacterium]
MTNKNSINCSKIISPIDFAREMLKNTAEDGTLYLNEWCDDNNYKVNIEWTKENLDEIICEFNDLVKDLKVIADFSNEFDGNLEMIPEVLVDDSVIDTYYNFVAPLESENKEDLNAEIISRVSDGIWGNRLIRHAQRLCRLFQLGAPEIVADNEERMLFATLIVHAFAKEIKKIS